MDMRGLVLFVLAPPGITLRSIHISDSFQDAQQGTNNHTQALAVSAKARQAFLPFGFWMAPLHRLGPQARSPRVFNGQGPQLHASHGPGAWRQLSEIPPSRQRRAAVGRAAVGLAAASGPEEDGVTPKDDEQKPSPTSASAPRATRRPRTSLASRRVSHPQRQRPVTPKASDAPSTLDLATATLPGSDNASIWTVPPDLRMPGALPCEKHGYHVSLEELFPGTGLAEAWDTRSSLRTAIRQALRDDLFAPLLRGRTAAQVAAATSLESACMISWSNAVKAADEGRLSFDRFTAALRANGVSSIDGLTFVRTLGNLCGPTPHGSLIDITPLRREVAHSWHQDCGIAQNTVLLGFPPRDQYVGGGVFSSHVQLSHPLRPSDGATHGSVVEYERLSLSDGAPPPSIPDEYVLRPVYSRGREVWVSDDAAHLHSTPDCQLREALWRFM